MQRLVLAINKHMWSANSPAAGLMTGLSGRATVKGLGMPTVIQEERSFLHTLLLGIIHGTMMIHSLQLVLCSSHAMPDDMYHLQVQKGPSHCSQLPCLAL